MRIRVIHASKKTEIAVIELPAEATVEDLNHELKKISTLLLASSCSKAQTENYLRWVGFFHSESLSYSARRSKNWLQLKNLRSLSRISDHSFLTRLYSSLKASYSSSSTSVH